MNSMFQRCTSCISKQEGFCPLLLLQGGCCRGWRHWAVPSELLRCRGLPPAACGKGRRGQEALSPRKAGGHNPGSFGTWVRVILSNRETEARPRVHLHDCARTVGFERARALLFAPFQLGTLHPQVSGLQAEPTGNKLLAEARPGQGNGLVPWKVGTWWHLCRHDRKAIFMPYISKSRWSAAITARCSHRGYLNLVPD